MADFALVSYSIIGKQKKLEDGRRINVVDLIMGDASNTYPSGGVAVTKGKLGCPVSVDSVKVFDNGGKGIHWYWDSANSKLRALISPATGTLTVSSLAHAHDLLVKGGQIASTTNDIAHYATDILGKEAATDATIAGAASATKGGVMSATPSGTVSKAQAELGEATTAFVLPTHTIRVEVIGY